MKRFLHFIVIFAAMIAAFTLASCGKKDSETTESSTDIVAEIPYVSDFTCDYFTGNGFNDRAERSTAFGCEDEILIKLSFTLSPKAFKDGKRKLTIKPVLSEGFVGSIFSANTSSVNDKELTAAYDVDDKKSKKCEIELKAKFNYSSGDLQIGYAYDEEEYQATGSYALSCGQSFKFTYDAETGGYIVSKGSNNEWLNNEKNLKIPETFAGKPVTVISGNLFEGCFNLSEVEIPDSITHIESDAFSYCENLRYNKYSDALYLGNEQNPYVALIKSDRDYITEARVNSATKVIYDDAFRDCSRLTSVDIPSGVASIGKRAFNDCGSLTTVTIPDSVVYIGEDAFYGCNKLKCNEYGDAKYLGNEQNPYLVFIKPKYTNVEIITNIDINETTKFINSRAFVDCVYLTSIKLPDNVTSIGCYTFSGCSGLTNITIPDSVTTIGDYAFSNCSSLTSIIIPDHVTSIGDYTFDGCKNLTNIEIPDSITSVGEWTFSHCLLKYNKYGNARYLGNKQNPYVVLIDIMDSTVESVDINSNTKVIYEDAISCCKKLKNITIPDGVISIGKYAFSLCYDMASVTIPNSVTNIGERAFGGCINLTYIEIPDSITSIRKYMFYGCSSLTNVKIPSSVTSIGDYAFGYYSSDGCCGLTSITIPSSVTSIGEGAFSNCSSLTSVIIPDSIARIGYSAFYNCGNLTNIVFKGTIAEWQNISHEDSYTTQNVTIKCSDGDLEFQI